MHFFDFIQSISPPVSFDSFLYGVGGSMRTAILACLFVGFVSFGEYLQVQVKELKQFNSPIKEAQNFKGSLQKLVDQTDWIDNESTEAVLIFRVKQNQHYLKTAKRIARYAWSVILPDTRTRAPFPCGGVSKGKIKEKSSKKKNVSTHSISGMGAGYLDTCTGNGGPGAWGHDLEVEYDVRKNFGKLSFNIGSE